MKGILISSTADEVTIHGNLTKTRSRFVKADLVSEENCSTITANHVARPENIKKK